MRAVTVSLRAAYKIIDLFSGAGGMSLGFVDPRFCGGFSCVLAVDNDAAALATHHANFGGKVVCGNIEDWLEEHLRIPKADIVIGGPPRQGLKLLNKKRSRDYRRALLGPSLEGGGRGGGRVVLFDELPERDR